jgi:RNA polymerase sigma-70 factor (ECF subfamily)
MLAAGNFKPQVSSSTARVKPLMADPFDRLFKSEYAKVVGIAYRVLGDRGEAEDVAQDVFVQFHQGHSAEVSYAAAWLHAAAAHAALNVVRSRRRRGRREQNEARMQGLRAVDPEEAVLAAEERRTVRQALARLHEREGAILALRYSGLSYAEVAAALRIKVTSVGTMLRRAEEAFRKEVERAASE